LGLLFSLNSCFEKINFCESDIALINSIAYHGEAIFSKAYALGEKAKKFKNFAGQPCFYYLGVL